MKQTLLRSSLDRNATHSVTLSVGRVEIMNKMYRCILFIISLKAHQMERTDFTIIIKAITFQRVRQKYFSELSNRILMVDTGHPTGSFTTYLLVYLYLKR